MRDAESALDQLISFCGDSIAEADVLSMFGLTAESRILELSQAILAGEIQTALTQLNELAQNGKDLGRLLSDLLNHFRNLLIYQVSRGDLSLLEVSEAEGAALKQQSALAGADAFTRILEVLADAELRLRDAASRKILVEISLLKAIEARNALPIDAVLKQLNQLRGGQNEGGAGVPPAVAAAGTERRAVARPETTTAGKPAATVSAAPSALAECLPVSTELATLWTKVVEAVGRVSPFTRSYLVDANPVSLEKNLLVIGFDPEFEDHLGLVDNARNHTLLQTKLAELGHANCQVKFIKAEAPAKRPQAGQSAAPEKGEAGGGEKMPATPASAATPARDAAAKAKAPVTFSKGDFKDDPLIQKALEIFKGQIVEVRS